MGAPIIRSRHSGRFAELLAARRQELLEALAAGADHESYLRLVGQVRGLDEATRLSDQADFELSGGH